MGWNSRIDIRYIIHTIYVFIMNNWIEIITIVWAFCMSIILGSYILCGV